MEIEAKLLQQFCTTVYWNSQVWTGVWRILGSFLLNYIWWQPFISGMTDAMTCVYHMIFLSLFKYLSQFQQTLSTLSIYIRWFANIRAFACQILHHVGTSSTPGQNVAFPHICNSIFLTKCPSLNPNNSGQPKWIVCRSIVSSCCVRRRQARGSEPMGPMQNKNLSMNFVEGSCRPRRWIFQGLKLAWFCVAEVWIKRKYKMLWGGEVPWTFVSTFYISHSSVMWLQDHGLRFCSMLQSLFRGPVCLKPTPLSKGLKFGMGRGRNQRMWTRGRDFRKTVLEPLDVVMLHFGRPCWFLMRMPVGSIIDMLMISLHRMSSRCAFTLLPPLRTLCMVAGVQDNFLLATKIFNGQLIPTYHGTATSNLGSIFQRGLLQLGLHSSWVLSLSTDTTLYAHKRKNKYYL